MQASKRSREQKPGSEDDAGGPVPRRLRASDEHPLVQLVDQRRREVNQLLEHIDSLQKQLVVARKKLEEARTLLKQLDGKADEARIPAGRVPEGNVVTSRVVAVASASRASSSSTRAGAHPPQARAGQSSTTELVSRIKTSDKPACLKFQPAVYINSLRKRKLKCLELNPAGENQFATSALDGILSFWRIEGQGHSVSLQHTVDCLSPELRRWPEDLHWHPTGESLVACYSADNADYQVSIIKNTERKKAVFLPQKPHEKGIINSTMFLPWTEGKQFVTGGCDHAVVLWNEREVDNWQAKVLHRSLHTSAVMGVAGVFHRKWVLSSGADKRVIAYDPQSQRAPHNHQLDSRAISVVPNPVDHNIYMVQTGTPGNQLKLFDIRAPGAQIHDFGWSQESSDAQTALVSSLWSPDGLCTVSGSVDPKIHIFDIRYIGSDPAMTINAHTKRVFKAAWHHTLPLLISISSDLQIGLHILRN